MNPERPLTILASPRHSGNPYLDLLYAALEQQGVATLEGTPKHAFHASYALAHYNWPEYFLNYSSRRRRWQGFLRYLVTMLAIKVRGKRIVWTMHNIRPHDEQGRFLPWLFQCIFFWSLDGIIALSAESAALMLGHYPVLKQKPLLQSRPGHYRSLFAALPVRAEAKAGIDPTPDTTVIGAFGSIRPYKNLSHLLRVFSQLPDRALRLDIAGGCRDAGLAQELTTLANQDPRITLTFGFLAEREFVDRVRAIALFVVPFRQTLNSGSVLFALSLNIPVLVPAKASLREFAAKIGPEWVRTYPAELTPAILADAIAWAAQPRTAPAPLDYYDWATCAQETAVFMRAIVTPDKANPLRTSRAEK